MVHLFFNIVGMSDVDLLASELNEVLGSSFPGSISESQDISEDWDSLINGSLADAQASGSIISELQSASSSELPQLAAPRGDRFLPSQLLDSFVSTLELQSSTNQGRIHPIFCKLGRILQEDFQPLIIPCTSQMLQVLLPEIHLPQKL